MDREFKALQQPIVAALRALAAKQGCSYATMRRLFYAWKSGGPLACIDKRHHSNLWKSGGRILSKETIGFWLQLQALHPGKPLAQLHRRFVELWKINQVPGLPRDVDIRASTGLPHGADYRSMVRRKAAISFRSLGKKAAL